MIGGHELGVALARAMKSTVRVNNVRYTFHEYQGDCTEKYNHDYNFNRGEYHDLGDGCYKAKQKGNNDV